VLVLAAGCALLLFRYHVSLIGTLAAAALFGVILSQAG